MEFLHPARIDELFCLLFIKLPVPAPINTCSASFIVLHLPPAIVLYSPLFSCSSPIVALQRTINVLLPTNVKFVLAHALIVEVPSAVNILQLSGFDIADALNAPVAPCTPLAPVAPCTPLAPVAPCVPPAPVDPCIPVAPCVPPAPVDPCIPVAPCVPPAPVAPCTPLAPVAPCTPLAPVAPCTPLAPVAP